MTSSNKDENEADNLEKDQDYPIVLMCLKCGNILGDSCSWICANKDLKTVTLRRVTNAVDSEQDLVTSEKGIDIGSTYRQLYCVMCDEIIGRVYQTTPRLLDNLRDVFTLDINKIQSYQVGSGERTTGVDSDDILDPPSAKSLQDDLYKIKTTICALNQRIVNIENALKNDEEEEEEGENQEKMEEEELMEGKKLDSETQKKPAQNSHPKGNTATGDTLSDAMSHVDSKTEIKQTLNESPPRGKRKRTR